jgi:Flp pilus assembly protein TadB
MKVSREAALVAAACAACCAPLVLAAAAVVPPALVAGAAATAVGAGVAGLVRRRSSPRAGPPVADAVPVQDMGITASPRRTSS